jgi:riboflavin kinase/FMN adenylyltransferase
MLGARFVVIGDDFRFGRDREGNYDMIKRAGEAFGYGVSHMGTLTLDGERVSSTRVREVLAAGDFASAERLLGHEYFIMGRVVYGRQLGRQLGVPTANIRLQRYKAALEGVY